MWSLRIVGILYLASGLWCAVKPELAADFLGFTLSDVGLAEFFSVYAGLQVGLALAMLTSSMKTDYLEAAIFFSLVTSTGLFAFRIFSLFNMGSNESLYAMAALEGVFVIILAVSFYQTKAELKT
jgi:hypothetical protein